MSSTLEENKALVRRWLAATDRHESSAVDEFLAPDYIDHNPPPVPDLPPGRDGVRAYMSYFYAGTPDGRHVIDDQIAEGDKIGTVLRGHGTHTGEVIGILGHREDCRDAGHRHPPHPGREAMRALGRQRLSQPVSAIGRHPGEWLGRWLTNRRQQPRRCRPGTPEVRP
jgi:predicted ester cyclase